MLDHREQEFGKNLGENLLWVVGAPGRQCEGLFPQLEQQLNLSAQAQ